MARRARRPTQPRRNPRANCVPNGYDHLGADGVRRENHGLDANMRGFRTERGGRRTTHLLAWVYRTNPATVYILMHNFRADWTGRTQPCLEVWSNRSMEPVWTCGWPSQTRRRRPEKSVQTHQLGLRGQCVLRRTARFLAPPTSARPRSCADREAFVGARYGDRRRVLRPAGRTLGDSDRGPIARLDPRLAVLPVRPRAAHSRRAGGGAGRSGRQAARPDKSTLMIEVHEIRWATLSPGPRPR